MSADGKSEPPKATVASRDLPEDMRVLLADYFAFSDREVPDRLPVREIALPRFPVAVLSKTDRGLAHAEAMRHAGELPPVIVCGPDFLDGRHRLAAARLDELPSLTAIDLASFGVDHGQTPIGRITPEFPPVAAKTVDGRAVRAEVPNQSSVGASLGRDYETLRGIREVPLAEFEAKPTQLFYAADDLRRVTDLAAAIAESGAVNPLIVVVEPSGPYVLEGGHRLAALHRLGAKSFPALVVYNLDHAAGIEVEDLQPAKVFRAFHGTSAAQPVFDVESGAFFASSSATALVYGKNVTGYDIEMARPARWSPDLVSGFKEFAHERKADGFTAREVDLFDRVERRGNGDDTGEKQMGKYVAALIGQKPTEITFSDTDPLWGLFRDYLIAGGYDGLIRPHEVSDGRPDGTTEYAPLHAHQIRRMDGRTVNHFPRIRPDLDPVPVELLRAGFMATAGKKMEAGICA